MKSYVWILLINACIALTVLGCQPSPEANVVGYMIAQQFGTLDAAIYEHRPKGTLAGNVVDTKEQPIENATVVVAQRTGEPYTATTDEFGAYEIRGVPVGKYVPAAVAPGYDEAALFDRIGIPTAVEVVADAQVQVPLITLSAHTPLSLPENLGDVVALTQTAVFTTSAPFPTGATAQAYSFEYQYNGAKIDTLRLYLPTRDNANAIDEPTELPLLFMVYPTHVDLWQSVSTAFASEGYALVAVSSIAERAVDIDAHARDALVALTLATSGELERQIGAGKRIADGGAVALGGSFSSAILNRLLRDAGDQVAAWVTVGGISNAFTGTADFYAGRISIPPPYELIIPALGSPRLYPLPFLRYSPTYVAGAFPPTLIIHTDADRIIPIDQAQELEAALRSANVPVDVFYYQDVSHYLQIDENLSDAGREMFYRVLEFAEKHTETSN